MAHSLSALQETIIECTCNVDWYSAVIFFMAGKKFLKYNYRYHEYFYY